MAGADQLEKSFQVIALDLGDTGCADADHRWVGAIGDVDDGLFHVVEAAVGFLLFSPGLVAALYAAAPGEAVFGPLGKGEGYVVARVSGIVHPLPPPDDPLFQQGVRQISKGIAGDVVESFADVARDKQGVTINTKLLDSVVGGGEGS